MWDYPEEKPVYVYKPVFDEAWLIEHCEALDVKFLLLYEQGDMNYFESDWKSIYALEAMLDSDSFTLEKKFGAYPYQIFVIRYLPNPEHTYRSNKKWGTTILS